MEYKKAPISYREAGVFFTRHSLGYDYVSRITFRFSSICSVVFWASLLITALLAILCKAVSAGGGTKASVEIDYELAETALQRIANKAVISKLAQKTTEQMLENLKVILET